MPFEYDIEKNNLCDGSILKAFALLGYGKIAEAEACIATARKLDPNEIKLIKDFCALADADVSRQ